MYTYFFDMFFRCVCMYTHIPRIYIKKSMHHACIRTWAPRLGDSGLISCQPCVYVYLHTQTRTDTQTQAHVPQHRTRHLCTHVHVHAHTDAHIYAQAPELGSRRPVDTMNRLGPVSRYRPISVKFKNLLLSCGTNSD